MKLCLKMPVNRKRFRIKKPIKQWRYLEVIYGKNTTL